MLHLSADKRRRARSDENACVADPPFAEGLLTKSNPRLGSITGSGLGFFTLTLSLFGYQKIAVEQLPKNAAMARAAWDLLLDGAKWNCRRFVSLAPFSIYPFVSSQSWRRVNKSRSSSVDSSVIQLSPVPTICWLNDSFLSIISSMRSSIVPSEMNL